MIDKLKFIGHYWTMRPCLIACLLVALVSSTLVTPTLSHQDEKAVAVCKPAALRAVQVIPPLRYRCRPGADQYDEAILKWPERIRALNALAAKLKAFTRTAWWESDVEDLNACSFKKSPGAFTKTEDERYRSNYVTNLLGNDNARLVIIPDPCYQTEYNGSVIFLVARGATTNEVTKALDGYFSRVDDSVTFDWADLPGELIVEVGTGNSMPPSLEKFYFSLNTKTHRIQPRRLFKDGPGFTNKIYSAMLLSDPGDVGLPNDAAELVVIRDHKLAPVFSTYSEDSDGKIEANGNHFTRMIYRWTGNYFETSK